MTFLGPKDGEPDGSGSDPAPLVDASDISAVTVRAPAGHLMCLIRVGTLTSVARVTPSVCGTEHGCDGAGHCVIGRR